MYTSGVMKVVNRKESWLLLLGDILVFVVSLWLTLVFRFGEIPTNIVFKQHLFPFGILFAIWCVVFFIASLYEKHTTVFKSHLPIKVLYTQIFNSFLAVVFFYFVPYFGITPKITLFIYIIISLTLIFIWRTYGQKIFGLKLKERAMILGRGKEMDLLLQEVNNNHRYGLDFVLSFDLDKIESVDFQKDIIEKIILLNISVVVIDLQNENLKKNLPTFYHLLFSKVRFVDINNLYEDIFDRVLLSSVSYNWFLENVSLSVSITYGTFKRLMDMVVSFVLGLLSLFFYPFICLAIKLEDGGSVFISQDRIGKNNKLIKIKKFRTMSFNDNEENKPKTNENLSGPRVNKITKVGAFLRKSRLDEIPQLWSIWRGDLSLVGPRPELPTLAQIYEKEVPYYNVRHLIQPGLSGWAQLYHENHPHQGANVEETKNKLSYDLYYVKNRSLILDLEIALKTVKALLSRTGK
jgi:exopolysaccharide biosynthesis polyprenyl glycosylphosphotransferase